MKIALVVKHGQEKVQKDISFYHMAAEVASTNRGMEVATDPSE